MFLMPLMSPDLQKIFSIKKISWIGCAHVWEQKVYFISYLDWEPVVSPELLHQIYQALLSDRKLCSLKLLRRNSHLTVEDLMIGPINIYVAHTIIEYLKFERECHRKKKKKEFSLKKTYFSPAKAVTTRLQGALRETKFGIAKLERKMEEGLTNLARFSLSALNEAVRQLKLKVPWLAMWPLPLLCP